jgi:biopolymer transport protein ExbD
MLDRGFLAEHGQMDRQIRTLSIVRPKGKSFKKTLMQALILTSLVDCFSILVIYLLVGALDSKEAVQSKGLDLPRVSHSVTLTPGNLVMFKNGAVYIDDKRISEDQLPQVLNALAAKEDKNSEEKSLIIQADRKLNYLALNPLILAAVDAGFSKLKFAVIQKD